MDELTDVYNELIMEHSMNSYNKKKLENADYCEVGHNPNCGDEITLQLKLNGNKIEDENRLEEIRRNNAILRINNFKRVTYGVEQYYYVEEGQE